MAQNGPWHVLLLAPQQFRDCWRRDEGLWGISGNAWKHEIMGNCYVGCLCTDETQKSHRTTGCISSHGQEITCFNKCLLVCCRAGGLCWTPGTWRQKMLSCRVSPAAGGEQLVACPVQMGCPGQHCCGPQTPQQIQSNWNHLCSKERWLRSLKLPSILARQKTSTDRCYSQCSVKPQPTGCSGFTEMMENSDELH